jgi:dephospho-CoA kinase
MTGGNRPPVIGIVGGIGSGKSIVAELLSEAGCLVSDADALSRQAIDEPGIRDVLVSWWGTEVLDAQGRVDRAVVADRVFADRAELDRLEGLLHPRVEAMRQAAFDAAPDSVPALVIDAPLLLEAGLASGCDMIIFVDAPSEVRLQRVADSRDWDEAEVSRREVRQMSLDEKRSMAHHVVTNHGRVEDLREQIDSLLGRLGRR